MTPEEFLAEWEDDAPYITAHTSGSTGAPKRILLDKEMVRRSAWRTIDFFGLDKSSRLHLCLDAAYIAGKMMLVRAAECGARITYETPSNRPLLPEAAADPIDLLAVVPSQLASLVERGVTTSEVRHIIVGGAPLPRRLAEATTVAGLDVWETYGMTETASHVALRRADAEAFDALPGISFAADGRGCLIIVMDDGSRIATNDMAELLSERSMRLLGRIDHVIITGGLKVHPEAVERRLEALMPAGEYYIVGEPDPKWGERVCLVAACPTPAEADMRSVLARHEMPKCILRVTVLPRTSTGKVRRLPPSEIF